MDVLRFFSFGGRKIEMRALRRFNFLAALLYLVQAILIWALSSSGRGVRPITTSFLTNDALGSQESGQSVMVQATHHLFDLNIMHVIVVLLLAGAVIHFLLATRLRRRYEAEMKAGINSTRWIDFAISAGLMVLLIALLAGVFDLSSLLLILGVAAGMGLTTALLETNRQFNYWLGLVTGFLPWLVTLIYLWGAHVWGSSLPAFVYWAVFLSLLFFAALAANFYLQFKRIGHWENYIFGERTYIILNFLAKSVLVWLIFAGTLR